MPSATPLFKDWSPELQDLVTKYQNQVDQTPSSQGPSRFPTGGRSTELLDGYLTDLAVNTILNSLRPIEHDERFPDERFSTDNQSDSFEEELKSSGDEANPPPQIVQRTSDAGLPHPHPIPIQPRRSFAQISDALLASDPKKE